MKAFIFFLGIAVAEFALAGPSDRGTWLSCSQENLQGIYVSAGRLKIDEEAEVGFSSGAYSAAAGYKITSMVRGRDNLTLTINKIENTETSTIDFPYSPLPEIITLEQIEATRNVEISGRPFSKFKAIVNPIKKNTDQPEYSETLNHCVEGGKAPLARTSPAIKSILTLKVVAGVRLSQLNRWRPSFLNSF